MRRHSFQFWLNTLIWIMLVSAVVASLTLLTFATVDNWERYNRIRGRRWNGSKIKGRSGQQDSSTTAPDQAAPPKD